MAVLRDYLRQRANLVRAGASHIQHMQKALELMNVKLTEVVSDVTGVTGLKIIQAILAGERDPLTLARLRNKHCKQQHRHHRPGPARQLARRSTCSPCGRPGDSWEHYQAQLRDLEDVIAAAPAADEEGGRAAAAAAQAAAARPQAQRPALRRAARPCTTSPAWT